MRFFIILSAIVSLGALVGCSQPASSMPAQRVNVAGEPLTIVGRLDQSSGQMFVEAAVPTGSRYVIHSMKAIGPQGMSYLPTGWRNLGLHPLPTGEAYAGENKTNSQAANGHYVQACWDIRYAAFSPPVGRFEVDLLCLTCPDAAIKRLTFTMEVLTPLDGGTNSRIVFMPENATPPPRRAAAPTQRDAPPPGEP